MFTAATAEDKKLSCPLCSSIYKSESSRMPKTSSRNSRKLPIRCMGKNLFRRIMAPQLRIRNRAGVRAHPGRPNLGQHPLSTMAISDVLKALKKMPFEVPPLPERWKVEDFKASLENLSCVVEVSRSQDPEKRASPQAKAEQKFS